MGSDVSEIRNLTLPTLIDRAAAALTGARTSAEVLEARDMARAAYDAAKSAGRMLKAKTAHDEVVAAVYRAQADAAVIEARAKVRLADEYDAAQERGEVAGHGGGRNFKVAGDNVETATASDLGLRRDEIYEARKLRDSENAEPGKIEAAAEAIISRGEEPTKAALRREVASTSAANQRPAAEAVPDPYAEERKGLAKYTREGLEDTLIEARTALADERSRRKKAEAERDDFKAKWKEATSESDMGRKMGNAQRERDTAKGRLVEEEKKNARLQRRVNIQDAEIKKIRAQLEQQVVTL